MVGSAIVRALRDHDFPHIITASSTELDLRDHRRTADFLTDTRPDVIVLAAARVGGIAANAGEPADFLSDNLRIQLSVLDAARHLRVPRLLFLGSSCVYPRLAPQPIPESALLSGPLEPTNDAYAIAKIAGIIGVQAVRRQDGLAWICAMPTNLYGPGDRFHPHRSHVLPALMLRCHEAKLDEAPSITVWGTGTPRREFLHVDDLARACLTLLHDYDDDRPVNIGTGVDLPVAELARMVADAVGYRGLIKFDPSRPDGTPRKRLDIGTLTGLGWRPRIGLADGIASTYAWFAANREVARV